MKKLLIANRGEIAIRIARTAADMGISTLAIASEDDQRSLHLKRADDAKVLRGRGPAAYLDGAQILAVAKAAGCDAIHPGYGFLSENAAFAHSCAVAGTTFVGPTPAHLETLGNKAEARALAESCAVPVLAGTSSAVTLKQARAFMSKIGKPVMLKALSGGGGRGIRLVTSADDLEAAYERCQSEAKRSFGDDRVYVEQALTKARHIEVQILGDGFGDIVHLGERDCTVQRRHQKLIEIAPSPALSSSLRARLFAAAIKMAEQIDYQNAGTFEFLVDNAADEFYFLEANPRLQVEHTVTEELWGVDIVRAQLEIAAGARIGDLALGERTPRAGFAIQARINAERFLEDGTPVTDGGTLSAFSPAGGPGVRVDTYGYRGYATNVGFDSLLAKLIVSSASNDFGVALSKTRRALGEFAIAGVPTNISFLRAVLAHPDVNSDALSTRFVDQNITTLLASLDDNARSDVELEQDAAAVRDVRALPDGVIGVMAPLSGTVVSVGVSSGEIVAAGQQVAVLEAMKMEHVVLAQAGGVIGEVLAAANETVLVGQPLLTIVARADAGAVAAAHQIIDLSVIRPDLAEVIERQEAVLDAKRPDAVARRHGKGAKTARENVDSLCDAGTFVEYGSLVVAAQRKRRSIEELMQKTPGDGVITGFGSVNGALFPPEHAQSLVVAFDETVLAGTMGEMAREKLKHVLAVARDDRRPVVLFAEGGGGRAGDTDLRVAVTGWTMDVSSYYQLGSMSGLTPLVGVTSGRCFAANAGMLACCDVIIATKDANIGVGGPSMIEGGRLGSFTPEEIGPMGVQTKNGVVDVLVEDEAEAVDVAKKYLAFFQGPLTQWHARDQRAARFVVPENRLRAYEVRKAIDVLADEDSVLELRKDFGVAIITSLLRVEGKPLGVIANNPLHLGGAIDADAADKASRFMKLCEAFGLPILMLCDTPGVMVGPEAEKEATVRKMGRMFITGANLTVPFFTIILRKAYGIGAELMAGGWFKAPRFVVSWPTGELGGMNIEGNVNLAHAAELAAIKDPQAKQTRFEELVAEMYATGRALAAATHNEVDNVIDPAESRRWIAMAMAAHKPRLPGSDKRIPFVDPW